MAGNRNSGNRTMSNPMVEHRADNVDGEANSRRIAYLNAVRRLPDVDLSDVRAVEERIDTFFAMCDEYGMTPLVGNLAANFGMTRQYFWEVLNGVRPAGNRGLTPEALLSMKKAYAIVNMNYEQALTTAKNPVPWIFYGKAALDWKETNETVITHKSESPRLQGGSKAEIEARYAEIVGVEEVPTLPAPEEEDELLS